MKYLDAHQLFGRLKSAASFVFLTRSNPGRCSESVGIGNPWLINCPDGEGIGVVVHGREPGNIVSDGYDIESKCSARIRIDRQLADESALHGKFHDFAGLIWIQIDPVTIADQQVSVGSEHSRG